MSVQRINAEKWAKDFHDTYERMAPQFGYRTREDSAVSWEELPAVNRNLMIAVCEEVLCRFDKCLTQRMMCRFDKYLAQRMGE